MIQQAIREPSAPPLATEKFQPMNSPTRTMPTPSAQTWPGPRTRRRVSRCGAAACTTVAIGSAPLRLDLVRELNLAFARGQQHVLAEVAADAGRVQDHPDKDHARGRPGGVLEQGPHAHRWPPQRRGSGAP